MGAIQEALQAAVIGWNLVVSGSYGGIMEVRPMYSTEEKCRFAVAKLTKNNTMSFSFHATCVPVF